MSCLHLLDCGAINIDLPTHFPSPFHNTPQAIAQWAARDLQARLGALTRHDFNHPEGGKMLGVLVVQTASGALAYLAAFSGMLDGLWTHDGFVPPVFDPAEREATMGPGEAQLSQLSERIQSMQCSSEYLELQQVHAQVVAEAKDTLATLKAAHKVRKAERQAARKQADDALLRALALQSQSDARELKSAKQACEQRVAAAQQALDTYESALHDTLASRKALSQQLQKQLFDGYQWRNWAGERGRSYDLFDGLPPSGAGDCAAPKLLHFARQNALKPIALAEFWWGAPPASGIRRHAQYYPACRSKCGPLLPFLLQGLAVDEGPGFGQVSAEVDFDTVYEDEHLIVVNKPEGLLSVPGRDVQDSVFERLKIRYPTLGALRMVHRLDLSTSGLLMAAKTVHARAHLQQQFERRQVQKRYVALLCGRLAENAGEIDLPLRVDLDDRPRQTVCYQHGKSARTRWQKVAEGEGITRVHFFPITGRTHQLRVHAAHPKGLNAPIQGDELYGDNEGRLRLHAEQLRFRHPVTEREIQLSATAPF